MKKYFILLFSFSILLAQDLSGVRICLDPGHGGHESDDRYISETGFWESEGNLTKALKLEKILLDLGASVALTRRGNNGTSDDLALSERRAVADNFNSDIFISIHSNGFNGGANYTMTIFNGKTETPTIALAKDLANALAPEIYAANRTTRKVVIGDLTLNPTWSNGYGVLYPPTMPAVISEGSFHDYIPESWRLQNIRYRENEAWALSRGILNYFGQAQSNLASLAGIVADINRTSNWTALTDRDKKLPVNNIKVKLLPNDIIYEGDSNNNGYFAFDSLAPGNYTLTISAPLYESKTASITLSGGKTHFLDFLLQDNGTLPPAVPTHIWMSTLNDNSVQINCNQIDNADTYIAYLYNQESVLIDSILSNDASITFTATENKAIYYRIAAKNESGISSLSTRLYGFARHSNGNKLLVVNGFDRGSNTRFDYIKMLGSAIVEGGYGFDYVLNEYIINETINLSDYKSVIWILGDESTVDETFSGTEQSKVKQFLENGGNLFVSGSEIGWDLDYKGTASDKDFFNNYLMAGYSADAPGNTQSGSYSVSGISGTLFDGLGTTYFDDGSHGTINVDWPDALIAKNGASVVMTYNNVSTHKNAAIAYKGSFSNSIKEGNLVYLAFPIETVYPEESRKIIVKRILNIFIQTETDIRAIDILNAENFQLLSSYPNPFNSETRVAYKIYNAGNADVFIYDITGKFIKHLMNNTFHESGEYELKWDGLSASNKPVASGVYLIQFTMDGISQSLRCTLQK